MQVTCIKLSYKFERVPRIKITCYKFIRIAISTYRNKTLLSYVLQLRLVYYLLSSTDTCFTIIYAGNVNNIIIIWFPMLNYVMLIALFDFLHSSPFQELGQQQLVT